ncbi:MAG TPA: TetR family transcriptional regulator [Streptosporangiaceae bacterium]|jgi:AcrR family transcriptional regulator|nr:TetR family transcriptional regulator [Streptosporangiaceae bacterium]
MEEQVKPDRRSGPLRRRQVARTEHSIITAATRLFLANGYAATTLAAVAEAAEVATRTVYVRFGTKAELLKRVLDVAIVGDTEPVGVVDRATSHAAMTALTRLERIAAVAAISREIMDRAGPLFGVAQDAASVEPLIAEHLQRGREETRDFHRAVWTRMRDDGLLSPSCDLEWIIDTASVIAAGETYFLIVRTFNWNLDAYEQWLRRTLTHLTTGTNAEPEAEH